MADEKGLRHWVEDNLHALLGTFQLATLPEEYFITSNSPHPRRRLFLVLPRLTLLSPSLLPIAL